MIIMLNQKVLVKSWLKVVTIPWFQVSGVRLASGYQQNVQNSMLDVGCSMFIFYWLLWFCPLPSVLRQG